MRRGPLRKGWSDLREWSRWIGGAEQMSRWGFEIQKGETRLRIDTWSLVSNAIILRDHLLFTHRRRALISLRLIDPCLHRHTSERATPKLEYTTSYKREQSGEDIHLLLEDPIQLSLRCSLMRKKSKVIHLFSRDIKVLGYIFWSPTHWLISRDHHQQGEREKKKTLFHQLLISTSIPNLPSPKSTHVKTICCRRIDHDLITKPISLSDTIIGAR